MGGGTAEITLNIENVGPPQEFAFDWKDEPDRNKILASQDWANKGPTGFGMEDSENRLHAASRNSTSGQPSPYTFRSTGNAQRPASMPAGVSSLDAQAIEEQDRLYAIRIVEEELGLLNSQPEETSSTIAVKQRFQRVNSCPHEMRTNSGRLPDSYRAEVDHSRLLEHLFEYGLRERHISGDGNCQFRSISDQLFGSPDRHSSVRSAVTSQMKANREWYQEYIPGNFDAYLKSMARNGEWGDNITLQAAADLYGVKICLVTSFKDKFLIEILPKNKTPRKEIWMSFYAEVHYNSIYPVEEFPGEHKKKFWFF